MAFNIFVVNPGSTSTKIAVYTGTECVFNKVIRHDPDDLKVFNTAVDQFEYRFGMVMDIAWDFESIDAFVGRGGFSKPLKGGTYIVDKSMLEDIKSSKYGDHASNLGAIIASTLANKFGKKAYVVNPPVVDELMNVARFTGLPQITRISAFHALNQKAAAIHAAHVAGIDYCNGRFIVAHLGGGISVGAHDHGRVVDVNNALEEGPFSPERAGGLPTGQLVEMCFSGQYTKSEIKKMLTGRGGLYAYTGTTDCKKLEIEAESDGNIKLILDAMIYKVSREMCACAAALYGIVDNIVVTGGLAYSSYIVEGIKQRVGFLGKFVVYPGENEAGALAEGALRVLDGLETACEYEKGGV
jgi:butyrate kinase